MRFNVKMTAVAASLFAMAVIGGAPTAHALDESTSKQSTNQKTSAAEAKKPVMVTVQPGDSLSAIADAHSVTWVRIFDANETIADPNLIHPGEELRIPEATEELPDRYGALTIEQVQTMPAVNQSASQATTTAPASTARVSTPGNTYYWGQCTWYVKNRRPDIGNMWGNAGYSWISNAQRAGYGTGSAPQAGAIAVQPGHVAYVESVDGAMVNITEMNGNGNFGRVTSRTVPASTFTYIY